MQVIILEIPMITQNQSGKGTIRAVAERKQSKFSIWRPTIRVMGLMQDTSEWKECKSSREDC